MPKITYKPEGAEPKVWNIAFGKFMSSERIVIEKATGLPWSEIKGRLFEDDTLVVRAFLYVLLKREIPTLKIDQVEFCEDDYELDATWEERAAGIERLEQEEAAGNLSDEARNMLEELRKEQAADPDVPKEKRASSPNTSETASST